MTGKSQFISLDSPLSNDGNRISYAPNATSGVGKGHVSDFENNAPSENGAKEDEKSESYHGAFGPSVTVWEQLKKTKRTHIILGSVLSIIIGIILGAGVTVIIFTQTSVGRKDVTVSCPSLGDFVKQITETSTAQSLQKPATTLAYLPITRPDTTVPCIENVTQTEATTRLTVTSRTPPGIPPENCGVAYEGKCFRAIVQDELFVHLNESERLCEDIGWKLANIYSRSHYFMIEGYLRSKFPSSGYISAWTGMTMDPVTHQIILSDGTNSTLTGIHWHHGYPSHDSSYTHMGIDVLEVPTKDTVQSQGLWNYDPLWNANTALCENL